MGTTALGLPEAGSGSSLDLSCEEEIRALIMNYCYYSERLKYPSEPAKQTAWNLTGSWTEGISLEIPGYFMQLYTPPRYFSEKQETEGHECVSEVC